MLVVLVGVTLLVYLPTVDHGFISFDDPGYVTENGRVLGGLTVENVMWAFSSTSMSNWHPVTWLSHLSDVSLFGMSPGGHHLVNVLFHLGSTVLVFFCFREMTGAVWASLMVSALFALHPLHVESVAWVAERKDVLSGMFWFLTLLLYGRYARSPGRTRYILVLVSFALGLMSKPMLVTLPLVLLLLDWWPLGRGFSWSLVREKVPLFVLSGASCLVTLYAQQRGGAMKTLEAIPLGLRLGNSAVAFVRYIAKMFLPRDLAVLYPFPSSLPLWEVVGSFVLLGLVCGVAVAWRRRRPYLLTGWFWFLVTLVPVIGLVQVGGQSMADRYTYLPLTGLFIVLAWGAGDLAGGWRYRREALAGLGMVAAAACALLTWHQVGYWKDNLTLYRHTLEVTGGNYVVRNNFAKALAEQGHLDAAIQEYQNILGTRPNLPRVHNNLGSLLAARGALDDAMHHYAEALRLASGSGSRGRIFDRATAHFAMGNVFLGKGRSQEAIREFEAALELMPEHDRAFNNLGVAYSRLGRFSEAIRAFQRAIELNPYNDDARRNLALGIRDADASRKK